MASSLLHRITNFALFWLVLVVLLVAPASAQKNTKKDVELVLSGLVQTEANYGWISNAQADEERTRLGFNLRRVRLRATAHVGPKAGAFIHLDADNGDFGILDAFVFYEFTPRLRFRMGRMASAQPRALILTPVVMMDATERAAIALLWNGSTLGMKGRDFGLDLRYKTAQAEAIIFVHHGDGSFDRLRSNYQPNIVGDVTGGAEWGIEDMAVSGYLAFTPQSLRGVEVGGFVGYNGRKNPNTVVNDEGRDYLSYAAHLYWGATPGSQAVRLKADVIGVQYEETPVVASQQSLGLSLLGAVSVHRAAEVFARVESYNPNLDAEGEQLLFVTGGFSFSLSQLRGQPYPQERITFGYNVRLSEVDDVPTHHLAVLQLQLVF
ncbi:MAG TPA: hypothetical protein VKP65_01460 [Rhodothermales bacterium]|nr:hypothetical protein [Rhodothermales bacterium]